MFKLTPEEIEEIRREPPFVAPRGIVFTVVGALAVEFFGGFHSAVTLVSNPTWSAEVSDQLSPPDHLPDPSTQVVLTVSPVTAVSTTAVSTATGSRQVAAYGTSVSAGVPLSGDILRQLLDFNTPTML
jgi:hypothetical protein